MMLLALAVLAAAPAPRPSLEAGAWSVVTERFETKGRATPRRDEALDATARILAARALATSPAEATELLTLTAALSESGGWDTTPRAVVLRGEEASELLLGLQKQEQLTAEPASHAGLGVASSGPKTALCLLLADRRFELASFPRVIAKPAASRVALCGRLLEPLTSATVFVTRPHGEIDQLATQPRGEQLCAGITFETAGRHVVEVLGRGERGPQVVALFFVQVGPVSDEAHLRPQEPETVEEAAAAITTRIGALRAAMGAPALIRDPTLDATAQAYATRLATEGFFTHVSPEGQDLQGRLRAAGYAWSAAGENLGLASGPLGAHFSIEQSPGHRKNLLDPAFTQLGLGQARNPHGQLLLVEVLAAPALPSGQSPLSSAYQALDATRKGKALPPLERDATLEALAQSWAQKALAADTPKATIDGESLADRVFAQRGDLAFATVDFFVADVPAAVRESKNAVEPRSQLVGIGLVKGASARYAGGRYWVAVIYASRRSR